MCVSNAKDVHMTLSFCPATEVAIPEMAALFTRAFDGYIGGTRTMLANDMSEFLSRQGDR
jgi:hypothetical protein